MNEKTVTEPRFTVEEVEKMKLKIMSRRCVDALAIILMSAIAKRDPPAEDIETMAFMGAMCSMYPDLKAKLVTAADMGSASGQLDKYLGQSREAFERAVTEKLVRSLKQP